MKKYNCVFVRRFDVEVEAENIQAAQVAAGEVIKQFPEGTVKLHSVKAEDYVEPVPDMDAAQEGDTGARYSKLLTP